VKIEKCRFQEKKREKVEEKQTTEKRIL